MNSASTSSPKTILAVDDSPPVLKLVSETLELQGYRVLQASNADAALRIFQKNLMGIDLVIADILMPGMNGLEMVSKIVSRRPQIQVLYISDSGVLAREFTDSGDVAFLEKPFSLDALTLTVHQLLVAGDQGASSNKRKFTRILTGWTVTFAGQQVGGEGHLKDLSVGGCSIDADKKIPKDIQLTLEISMPMVGLPIQVKVAQVQWVTEKQFGVKFIEMDEEDRDRLHRVCGTLLSKPI